MNKPEWRISDGAVPYDEALATMEARVADIRAGRERELVWLLEHPPLYTAGTSAKPRTCCSPCAFPSMSRAAAGNTPITGPASAWSTPCSTCASRRQDVRRFVSDLEEWTIRTLARFSVTAERRAGRVGVWVARPDKPALPDGRPREDKIAAIGVRIRHWVSFHGLSINVEPDLSHYAGIVPCGIADHGVTSLVDLGLPVTMADLDMALAETFDEVFRRDVRPSAAA